MSLLTQVRQQYQALANKPKAISHRPDLAGREHIYRQGGGMAMVTEMNRFADYASVYQSYAWVQKAISKIAENLAGLPLRVVNAEDKPLDGHPLTELFANVNDQETPLDLWSGYVIHMMLGGETFYQFVPDARGRPVEVWLRRPDQTAVYPDASRLAYPTALAYLYEPELGDPITVDAAWMAHDKFYNPLNAWRGLAPIHAVREGIVIDLFAQAWSKRFFRNSTRPDFAIVAPSGITKSERDAYEARFLMEHQGVSNAHLPVILEEGVTDIKTFSFPPKDLEWLQQREFSRDEVGAVFGVPDEIMGYGKDTYENFQTALEVFWTLTMQPLIRRRDAVLTHHLSRYGLGLRPGERLDTDLSDVGVLQEDLAPKVDLAQKFWQMGVPFNTLDEALKLGVGPVPGGEIGYLAGMLKTVEQVINPPEPPPMLQLPPSAPRRDEPGPEEQPQARLYLPPGAKEQARRALKKLIQAMQDYHLRGIREGKGWQWMAYDTADLQRWLGDEAASTILVNLHREIEALRGDHDTVNAAYNALKSDAELTRLLEVAAPAFFTGSLPRAITPEWVKAMVLRLDRDDDEAEQLIRLALDKRTTRTLTELFSDMVDTLYPEGYGEFQDPNLEAQRVRRLFEEEQRLYDTLSRALQDGTDLGVSVAVAQLETIGYGFDWTLANIQAREWALAHTGTLIRDITDVTARGVQQAMARWIDNGEPLEALIHDIRPYFSRQRAERIAVTETTRAYQQGNETAWRESGVVAQMEWQTVRDERVCPQCGPMHGQRASVGGTFNGVAAPPRHPGCRCFTLPVVEEVA